MTDLIQEAERPERERLLAAGFKQIEYCGLQCWQAPGGGVSQTTLDAIVRLNREEAEKAVQGKAQ